MFSSLKTFLKTPQGFHLLKKLQLNDVLTCFATQRRHLNLHEHMNFCILEKFNLPVPKYGVAKDAKEAVEVAKTLGEKDLIMKAQVLAGGRGKGKFKKSQKGGVIPISTLKEAEQVAGDMLNDVLVTKQTGEQGRICNSVMIAQKKKAKKEYYVSMLMERLYGGPVVISSAEGGVEIEQVAQRDPNAIQKSIIDVEKGLDRNNVECVIKTLGIKKNKSDLCYIITNMYKLFKSLDATLVEINPLVEDEDGKYCCLDAKINFDNDAEFRQKEIFSLRDLSQENPLEVEAAKHNLSYIPLDGNIGCMVNGAGLALATLDIIKLYGGNAANFLDVGGGATAEQVKEAFKIITTAGTANVVLVNIFGGIMKCDVIATGILKAAKELKLKLPLICRLQGTNFKEAKDLIINSGEKIIVLDDLTEAANLAVKIACIVDLAKEINLQVSFEVPECS